MNKSLLDLLRSVLERESTSRHVVSFTPVASPSTLQPSDSRKLLHPVSGWISVAYDEREQYIAVLLQRPRNGNEFVLVQVAEDERVAYSVWRRDASAQWHLIRGNALQILTELDQGE